MVAERSQPFENDEDGDQLADALSPEQNRALAALLAEPTIARAAAVSGVSERTIYRWLDEPEFSTAFRKARREAFKQAVALTQKYAPMAVQTLAKVMTDCHTVCSCGSAVAGCRAGAMADRADKVPVTTTERFVLNPGVPRRLTISSPCGLLARRSILDLTP